MQSVGRVFAALDGSLGQSWPSPGPIWSQSNKAIPICSNYSGVDTKYNGTKLLASPILNIAAAWLFKACKEISKAFMKAPVEKLHGGFKVRFKSPAFENPFTVPFERLRKTFKALSKSFKRPLRIRWKALERPLKALTRKNHAFLFGGGFGCANFTGTGWI
jgi:hypothetical protein